MLKKFWFLFLVLLIEGSSLMAVEIMGAKLLAPFYSSSLYVWTAVLCIIGLLLAVTFMKGATYFLKTGYIKQISRPLFIVLRLNKFLGNQIFVG